MVEYIALFVCIYQMHGLSPPYTLEELVLVGRRPPPDPGDDGLGEIGPPLVSRESRNSWFVFVFESFLRKPSTNSMESFMLLRIAHNLSSASLSSSNSSLR